MAWKQSEMEKAMKRALLTASLAAAAAVAITPLGAYSAYTMPLANFMDNHGAVGLDTTAMRPGGWITSTDAHGLFDNLFGVRPEGGGDTIDTKGSLVLKPNGNDQGLRAAKFPDNEEGRRFQSSVEHKIVAGDYPLILKPDGHMSVGGSHPA